MLKTTLLTIFLFAAGNTFAQLAIRPYGGINASQLSGDLFEGSTSKSGMGYQIGADLEIGNKLYFQPGIQLEGLTNTKSFDDVSIEDIKITRTYMRIPVMVGYRLLGDSESDFNLRLFTGPNAAFRINSKAKGALQDVEDDITESLKSAIFGWNLGFGVDLISIIFVDMGYQIGLSEVFDESERISSGIRNNLFYANAGIRIRF